MVGTILSKHFTNINLLILTTMLCGFIDEETKAERAYTTFPSSKSWQVVALRYEHRQSVLRTYLRS